MLHNVGQPPNTIWITQATGLHAHFREAMDLVLQLTLFVNTQLESRQKMAIHAYERCVGHYNKQNRTASSPLAAGENV